MANISLPFGLARNNGEAVTNATEIDVTVDGVDIPLNEVLENVAQDNIELPDGTMTSKPIEGDPTVDNVLLNLVEEAPKDGKQYARKDGTWAEVQGGDTSGMNTDLSNITDDGKQKINDIVNEGEVGVSVIEKLSVKEVKVNGNIVLQDGEGSSREYMAATPSGDPLHYMYELIGATWNAETEFWEMNRLTDITQEQMRNIYYASSQVANVSFVGGASMRYFGSIGCTIRTIPTLANSSTISLSTSFLSNTTLESVRIQTLTSNNISSAFRGCSKLKYIYKTSGGLNFTGTTAASCDRAFENCSKLEECYIKTTFSLSFKDSPLLNNESIAYIVRSAASTTAITITLHPDAYARAMADEDIKAALAEKTNVTLASA